MTITETQRMLHKLLMKDPIFFDEEVGTQQIRGKNNIYAVPFNAEDRKKMNHFPSRFMDNKPRTKAGKQYLETGTTIYNY